MAYALSRFRDDGHDPEAQLPGQALGHTENASAARAGDPADDRTARLVVREEPFACARWHDDDWAPARAGHLQQDTCLGGSGETSGETGCGDDF